MLKINVSNIVFEIMTKKFTCEFCLSTFTVKSSVSKHINQIHKKIRFNCDQCEKSYTSKQNLEVHVKSVHENFKLNCLNCNSIFKTKSAFKKHHISKHTPRSDGIPV